LLYVAVTRTLNHMGSGY